MSNTKRGIEKLLGVIIFLLLPLLVIPTALFGEETDKESKVVRQGSLQEEPKSKPNFVLAIGDSLISLNAKDASLVEIVEEIGSRMKIDVITKIPEEKKITTKFDKLPLKAAIERLREFADIGYIRDSEKEKGKITKILVFPKGKEEEISKPEISAGEEALESDKSCSQVPMSAKGVPPGYSSEIIQVKFREGTKVVQPEALLPPNLRNSVDGITRLFTLSEEQLDKIGASGLNLWFQITLKPGTDAAGFIEDLKRVDSVEIAEPAPLPAPPP